MIFFERRLHLLGFFASGKNFFRLFQRQSDLNDKSAATFVARDYGAAMASDRPFGDGEAQSRAAASAVSVCGHAANSTDHGISALTVQAALSAQEEEDL